MTNWSLLVGALGQPFFSFALIASRTSVRTDSTLRPEGALTRSSVYGMPWVTSEEMNPPGPQYCVRIPCQEDPGISSNIVFSVERSLAAGSEFQALPQKSS